jgi:hypothetical protein
MGISSLALPPLGCGLGGLNWTDVKNLIDKHLGAIADLDVYVYESTESKVLPDDFQQGPIHETKKDDSIAAQQALF